MAAIIGDGITEAELRSFQSSLTTKLKNTVLTQKPTSVAKRYSSQFVFMQKLYTPQDHLLIAQHMSTHDVNAILKKITKHFIFVGSDHHRNAQ